MDFEQKSEISENPEKLIRDRYGYPMHNMGTTKKYRASVSFSRQLLIFSKSVG
jgi:hypothetical protein